MINVDETLISKLEALSKLSLGHEERQNLKTEITAMITMFSKIGEVNTEGVEPLTHLTSTRQPFREDTIVPHEDTDKLISLAPKPSNQYFNVPKVIE